MRRDKKAVQAAPDKTDGAVKPVPPDDMWEELDKAVAATAIYRPEGAITTMEFAARYKVNKAKAAAALEKLVADGKMYKHYSGGKVFYLLARKK